MSTFDEILRQCQCCYCCENTEGIGLPCGHTFCKTCYYNYYKPKIIRIREILASDASLINGRRSHIGCPFSCQVSILTLSPTALKDLFLEFNDAENAETIIECKSFLSGITTFFLYCQKCGTCHIGLAENPGCGNMEGRNSADDVQAKPKSQSQNADSHLVELENIELKINSLLKQGQIENLLTYSFVKTEEKKQNSAISKECARDLLIVLRKEEFKPIAYSANNGVKISLLTKNNIKNYSYFTLCTAYVVSQDDRYAIVPALNLVHYSHIFAINAKPSSLSLRFSQINIQNPAEERIKNILVQHGVWDFITYNLYCRTDHANVGNPMFREIAEVVLALTAESQIAYNQDEECIWLSRLTTKNIEKYNFFTIAKCIAMRENTDFICVSDFDMICYTEIFKFALK
jgi:hypothetical protein